MAHATQKTSERLAPGFRCGRAREQLFGGEVVGPDLTIRGKTLLEDRNQESVLGRSDHRGQLVGACQANVVQRGCALVAGIVVAETESYFAEVLFESTTSVGLVAEVFSNQFGDLRYGQVFHPKGDQFALDESLVDIGVDERLDEIGSGFDDDLVDAVVAVPPVRLNLERLSSGG